MDKFYEAALTKKQVDEIEDYIEHYGTPRHSGRYPWGSGKNPQRNQDILSRHAKLKKEGYSKGDIAKMLGFRNSSEMTAAISEASKAKKADEYRQTVQLRNKGYSKSEIARRIGVSEGTVRNYLKRGLTQRMTSIDTTTDIWAKQLKDNPGMFLDVGSGTEHFYNISDQNRKNCIEIMKRRGYEVHTVDVVQLGTNEKTKNIILCPKDTSWAEVKNNLDKVMPPQSTHTYVDEEGKPKPLHAPVSIKGKRVMVRYNEEGGVEKDGTMEIRRGVQDLDLGDNHYAQVRINVDNSHYLKGMAMYGPDKDFPDGVDIIFNTNKHVGTPKMDVFKPLKEDQDPLNQFGALIDRQNDWTDENGKEHEGALNIVRGEGEWSKWSKSVASQMLSKQSPVLAKEQLTKDYKMREEEYKEIMSLENDTIKRQLLKKFSDECDGAAVHLKAAAFPRQGYHVLLPLTGIKENEIYAPGYENGEKVVLVRYPHGGIFEMPELTVNNKVKQGKEVMGDQARDTVGIHPKIAGQLSGADFDGDTVLVIPNNEGKIKSAKDLPYTKSIDDLKNFEPKELYKKGDDETPTKGHFNTQMEMGKVSNLITDMTLKGAPLDDIARAVRHSMVVIDAEKHNLNADMSYDIENIQELKDRYQAKDDPSKPGGGAATLISRASSEVRDVPERRLKRTEKDPVTGEYLVKEGIDVKTGKYVYEETGRTYIDRKTGKEVRAMQKGLTKMGIVDDARELMSGPNHEGYRMERVYADYANKCKSLANEARKTYVNTGEIKRDPSAAKEYANEVASIKAKVVRAEMNAPYERMAQRKGNMDMKSILDDDPSLYTKKDELRKEKGKALQRARRAVGAKKTPVTLTDKEWEAIQAGAVSANLLKKVIDNADMDDLRSRAMPKNKPIISATTQARIKAYASKGKTQAEIASALGISASTVSKILAD